MRFVFNQNNAQEQGVSQKSTPTEITLLLLNVYSLTIFYLCIFWQEYIAIANYSNNDNTRPETRKSQQVCYHQADIRHRFACLRLDDNKSVTM